MFKPMVVAAAALAIGGSSIVYAQQHLGGPGGYHDGGPGFEQRHRLSAADMAAFTDARIAALKAGLELTPDQAKNWPAFEQALRDMAQLRMERRQAREAAEQQQSRAADHAVRAAGQAGRQPVQDRRRPEAYRRHRRAAFSKPRRRPEAPLQDAGALAAAASSPHACRLRGWRRSSAGAAPRWPHRTWAKADAAADERRMSTGMRSTPRRHGSERTKAVPAAGCTT